MRASKKGPSSKGRGALRGTLGVYTEFGELRGLRGIDYRALCSRYCGTQQWEKHDDCVLRVLDLFSTNST